MSPIIKEPDGNEQIPAETESAITPFPEDISIPPNPATFAGATGNASKVNVQDKQRPSKPECNSDKRKAISSTKFVHQVKSPEKIDVTLKRSQSMKSTRASPYDHQNGSKVSILQTKSPQSKEYESASSITKQTKSGKFKMFKNRWSMFPKCSSQETETKELHNLRRSQSMRIPSRSSHTISSLMSISECPSQLNLEKKHVPKSVTKYDIKNSKSMNDIRHYAKKETIINKNHDIAKMKENIIEDQSKNDIEKDEAPKNFAHKTIDVIRKSVQSRLKEKQSKKKQEKQDKETREVTGNSSSKSSSSDEVLLRKLNKNDTTTSKDVIKSNSKRKKNDMNDDSEFKPKKKVSLVEKEKLKSITIDKTAKENNANHFSPKAQSKETNKKEFGNENSKINDKNYLKMNNKKNIKENKNNSRSANKKEQMDNVESIKNKNMCSYQYGNNIICYPDKIPARSQPSYAIQSHHVLFLNNIHETLSNSYKSNIDTTTFHHLDPVEKQKNIEPFPNLNKTPAKLRSSLPLLSDESIRMQDADESAQPSSLMRSCSAECVNEKTLSVLDQEIKTKSASPMSISNCDEEIPKVDTTQSSLSFNCNYDPYIDETMGEYLCEGEGESHFGSLFTENKSTWKDFTENFKLELDFNSGSYYFEGIGGDGAFGAANISYKNSSILNSFVSNNLSLNYEENDTAPINDETPKSLPLDNKIKIYDSRKRSNVQFCSLQNTDFTLRSQNSLETAITSKEKCDAPAKKQKYFSNDRMSESKRLQTTFDREKDKAENATKRTEMKIPKKKWESKLPLNESKENRKVVKNIPRASPVLPNRSKKLKESLKRTNAVTNTLPNLTRNDKVQKSMSENLITNKHEKEEPFRKEKSEIFVKEGTKPPGTRGVERGRTTSLIFLCNNEGKILKNHDSKIEDEKKCQDLSVGTSRRSKIDNSKTTLAKAFRGATVRAKQADPVKILRPTAPNGQTPSQIPSHISDQLKKLEADLCARTQEAQSAKEEVSRANRGLEALTVLVHYLTKEYNAFATPKLRAEVEQLRSQLTDVRLCLDESTAAARRLELEAEERCQKHEEVVKNLEETHSNKIATIILEHQKKLEEVLEKHNEELKEIINREEYKYESLIKSHNEELERIDEEWRAELDKQHKRHLHALEQLNSCHTQQLRDTEDSWRHREQTLQENNARLLKEQDSLKQQAKKLEETLLSDKDHRLQAAKRVCTALQNEVDSLKTVVDMRNSEVHKLRDQLADKERLSEELDCAKDRVRALQAKTEDLHAQMETKLQLERQLLTDRHALSGSLQREASINKRLSLENEELQWKLRQRETNPNATHSTSTLDLVTRCSSSVSRQQEGCKTGVLSPQFTPRSQRIGTKPHDKKFSQSFSNIPEDAGKLLRRAELHDNVPIQSPPSSPRVKAVIEKSNSVSFILDLNDTFPDEPFLTQSYHHSVKPRTPILQRKQLSKSFSHSLEKSRSTSLVQGSSNALLHRESRDVSSQPSKDRVNGINKEKVNGDLTSANCENGSGKRPSKYRTHSTSESSDSGDIERISPTGLSWTVPVHSNLKRYSKHIPANRFQLVPEPPRLLQQPDEDEYEENENEFVEVLELGEDINSAPLTMLFGQTPSTSVSLSDSDVSQCGSRADLSSEEDDDDDGTLLQKESQSRPQEGAGEAMIFPDVFDLKENGETCKSIPKSQISSAPSSDSEDANQATNAEEPLNMSWSEDVECDLTSSSEMQEL